MADRGEFSKSKPVAAGSDLARRLIGIKPFDGLSSAVLADLRQHLTARALGQDEPLFVEGGESRALAVVVSGRLEVQVGSGSDAFRVAYVEAGEVVGEIAALLGGDRTGRVRAATESQVIMISPHGVELLVDDAPLVVEHLYETATRRLRETQLAAVLDRHFGSGPDGGRHPFVDSVDWVSLKAGGCLFSKGDAADGAYVVVSGRLRELGEADGLESPPNGTLVKEIGVGELVGEMSLLRSAPRAATVVAGRDSTLARLPHDVFDRMAMNHPESMLGVVRAFLEGARSPQLRREPSALTIAVLGAHPTVDVHSLTAELSKRLSGLAETKHVWSGAIDDQLHREGIANSVSGTPGELRVRYWLDDAEKDHEIVVLELDREWTPWTRRAIGQADHVLILVDATVPDHAPGSVESEVYRMLDRSPAPPRTTLVLLHPPNAENPRGTVRWLAQRPVTGHLHIRRQSDAHLARLARLASGRAISLVLGGGGARGFAHLGVVQAMRELEIPVDMVAASSIGAPLAVAVAMEFADAELVERSASYFAGLKDYTIPIVAMLRGKAITEQITASAEGRDFEDCWVPFFCISTSISRSELVVHRHGPMAPAIRASVSVPGVLPPVTLGGDLLVDGASVNLLPVDLMREVNPTGLIIGVDVSRMGVAPSPSEFPPHISGWAALRSRLRRPSRESAPPSIGATLVAASLVGANRTKNRQLHEQIADLYLALDVQGLGLLDFSPANAQRGARVGYESSFDELKAWRDQHLAARTAT